MPTARQCFVETALKDKGAVVCWGMLDCSELVARGIIGAGGKDFTKTHNAQRFADGTPNLVTMKGAAPIEGDLHFYGEDWDHVIHVAIQLDGGRVLSADGATSKVQDFLVAQANLRARVRVHQNATFRKDWLGVHRNTWVDELDLVTR